MGDYTHTLEVARPVRTVYDQWTQFESFPEFMEGVQSVRQVDDTHTAWDVEIAGVERHFDATVVEQRPDERVAWTTTDGSFHAGEVRFEAVGADRTKVTLEMDFEPEGLAEKAGDALGIVRSRVKGDLERFKEFIEERGVETGAWRGEVSGGQAVEGDASGGTARPEGFDAQPG
jgi:uncharacterized membrane protein